MAKAWTFMIAFVAPVLMALLCLLMEQHLMGELNMRATHIFTLLSIYNMMRIPLVMLPLAVRSHESAKVVHERLDEFFSQPEVRPPVVEPPPGDDPKLRIYMNTADFMWEGDVNPTISFLSMTVRAGDVVAIVGDVGAGKSSILSAIMGQLRQSEGILQLYGSIAYVPSEPWLVSATLRENIVFGMPYDDRKYRAVIRACALTRDIKSLSRGRLNTHVEKKGQY
jgi:ATP-binding cassette subfamily C (CFTR/MRP) protein 1/ATP-binding cassette subfamily C (CFTR/MRP) protein 2